MLTLTMCSTTGTGDAAKRALAGRSSGPPASPTRRKAPLASGMALSRSSPKGMSHPAEPGLRGPGRPVVACGLLVGLSGLWLTLFYSHPDGSQPLLYALRLLFGSAMVVSIVLGFAAILRRDVNRHRAWMARGYAIGLGAGTQVLTLTVGEVILGPPTELSRALLMGAAWVINLAVAEWVIRMRAAPPARMTSKRPLYRGGASLSGGHV